MSDDKKEVVVNGGVSGLGLLGVAFVVLKLVGVIDWSWWWVTAPFWGGLALAAAVFLILLLAAGCVFLISCWVDWRRAKQRAAARQQAQR